MTPCYRGRTIALLGGTDGPIPREEPRLPGRAGVHTGEVEVVADDVRGLAVHEASRIMAEASPGEVLVSAITRELASGAGHRFEDRGERTLRGLDGPRRLFAVVV